MYQLAQKFAAIGWGPERVRQFVQADEATYGELEALLDGRAEVKIKSRLTASTTISLPAVKKPKRLKDCDGVWLSPSATKLFSSVDELPAAGQRTIEHRDLTEPLNDLDLIEEIGGEDVAVFGPVAELEITISQMVTKQAGGKPGTLLSDDKANIFYVRDPENSRQVLCVYVYWDAYFRSWGVYCGVVSAGRWGTGCRVIRVTAS